NMENLSRRRFLQVSAATGALVISSPTFSFAQDMKDERYRNLDANFGFYLKIDQDNTVTIGYSVPDDGTGVSTALPMLVAEELDVNFDEVKVEKLPPLYKAERGERGYPDQEYKGQRIHQTTGGSQAIRRSYDMLRQAGAEARDRLKMAAVDEMGVSFDQLKTENGYVVSGNKRIAYGALVEKAAAVNLESEPKLKDPSEYKVIGTDQPQKVAKDIALGTQKYCMDMELPGMLNAVIARCPYIDGVMKSYDDSAALKVPGVRKVVHLNRIPEDRSVQKYIADGIAVIADSHWAALKGREALEIEWDDSIWSHADNAWINSNFDNLIKNADRDVRLEHGDFDKAYAEADKTLEVVYDQPYWAHATMETPCGIADVQADKVTIIAGNQTAVRVMNDLMNVLPGYTHDQFDVTIMRLGSGFGRKFIVDAVTEAALCSKAVGKPVKVIWTREDDLEQDFYNPKGRHVFRGGLDKNGKLVAANYLHCSTDNDFATHAFPAHYVPNYRGEVINSKVLPSGPWRGPTENVAGYAMQSFVDEMAHLAGQDPLQYRIDMFRDTGDTPHPGFSSDFMVADRFINVLQMAAKNARWGKELPKGHGMGIASFMTFGGYAACVVEVKVDSDGTLTIINASGAADPGIAINPQGCRAQIESGTLDGFSAALGQKIEIEGGRVVTNNFDTYQMARIGTAPHTFTAEVVLNHIEPKGLGEMSLPPAIPALCNAIFAACGVRIRKLPIADQLEEAMKS
ncbi:MAG: xanthine dehydrogenase family protein molybdopterin-binding subunit, partial [Emcibacteraceae bacterium]|nr:xanthine dehydrogenase family protein molybdopterin-binding subunit [Emcibacteraceae bacterium]